MRTLLLISLFVFQSQAYAGQAKSVKARKSKTAHFFKVASSTNNVEVFLKKMGPSLSKELRTELLRYAKKSSNKHYYYKKIGKNSFQLKLTNKKWATFKFDKNVRGTYIGKTLFNWNYKASIEKNLSEISNILSKEYPGKKSAYNILFFSEAYALSGPGLGEFIFAGTGIIGWEEDLTYGWILQMQAQCSGKGIKRDFMNHKVKAKSNFLRIRNDLIAVDNSSFRWQYDSVWSAFWEVQECLADPKVGIINQNDKYLPAYRLQEMRSNSSQ